MMSLLTVASLRAGQGPADAALLSEQYFKNIQLMKGMPIDTFFDAMGMFAASMGNDCTFCRAKEAGPVPTEIDYGDYRAVEGIQMPFTWTATQTYMQVTIKLSDVAANAPVDSTRFARPR